METVVIRVKSKNDTKFLLSLIKKLGFDSYVISEFEERLIARKEIASMGRNQPYPDLSQEEIVSIVKETRNHPYGKTDKNKGGY